MNRLLCLVLLGVLTAACATDRSGEPAAEFAERVADAVAHADTAKLATLASQRCEALDADPRQTCYEDYFLTLSSDGRVALALGALEQLGNANRRIAADGHAYTHVIGIRAWVPGLPVAEVFGSCTSLYQSGCYHGVIQSYLTASDQVDSARVVGLCDEIAPAGTDAWLRFQCLHGLGHGLEMAWDWDLPRALAGCDWLNGTWDQESCYGGAIMENAVASAPGGHHTAKRALEQTGDDHGMMPDHGDHGGGSSATPPFAMRDSTDALYPCSVLGPRYQRACYLGHGGILLGTVDHDFAKAAEACDRTLVAVRDVCYMSLGTNASGATLMDTRESIAKCAPGDPDWRRWCFVGVVKNFIDVTADPATGIAFCRDVPEGIDRAACWRAVGEQLSVLYTTDTMPRVTACAATDAGEAACRSGAGLAARPTSP